MASTWYSDPLNLDDVLGDLSSTSSGSDKGSESDTGSPRSPDTSDSEKIAQRKRSKVVKKWAAVADREIAAAAATITPPTPGATTAAEVAKSVPPTDTTKAISTAEASKPDTLSAPSEGKATANKTLVKPDPPQAPVAPQKSGAQANKVPSNDTQRDAFTRATNRTPVVPPKPVAVKPPPKHKSTQTPPEPPPPITATDVKNFVKLASGDDVLRVLAMVHSAVCLGKLSPGKQLKGVIKLSARVAGSARSLLNKDSQNGQAKQNGPSSSKDSQRKYKPRGHKRRHNDEKKDEKRARQEE
jgi:hypothetical protein